MNAADRRIADKLAELGCAICGRPAEAHHLIGHRAHGRKDRRMAALCPDHHRNGGHGVAIHAGVQTWEALFGSQLSHHARQMAEIGMPLSEPLTSDTPSATVAATTNNRPAKALTRPDRPGETPAKEVSA